MHFKYFVDKDNNLYVIQYNKKFEVVEKFYIEFIESNINKLRVNISVSELSEVSIERFKEIYVKQNDLLTQKLFRSIGLLRKHNKNEFKDCL